MPTVEQALASYLDVVKLGRSAHTARAYGNAANVFRIALKKNGMDVDTAPSSELREDAIAWLVKYLKDRSPATERLYVQAMAGFYQYLDAERLADVNLSRLKLLIHQRARRPGLRLPQFPADDIARVLEFVQSESLLKDLDEQE